MIRHEEASDEFKKPLMSERSLHHIFVEALCCDFRRCHRLLTTFGILLCACYAWFSVFPPSSVMITVGDYGFAGQLPEIVVCQAAFAFCSLRFLLNACGLYYALMALDNPTWSRCFKGEGDEVKKTIRKAFVKLAIINVSKTLVVVATCVWAELPIEVVQWILIFLIFLSAGGTLIETVQAAFVFLCTREVNRILEELRQPIPQQGHDVLSTFWRDSLAMKVPSHPSGFWARITKQHIELERTILTMWSTCSDTGRSSGRHLSILMARYMFDLFAFMVLFVTSYGGSSYVIACIGLLDRGYHFYQVLFRLAEITDLCQGSGDSICVLAKQYYGSIDDEAEKQDHHRYASFVSVSTGIAMPFGKLTTRKLGVYSKIFLLVVYPLSLPASAFFSKASCLEAYGRCLLKPR